MSDKYKVTFNKPKHKKYVPKEGDYFSCDFSDGTTVYQCIPCDYGNKVFKHREQGKTAIYAMDLENMQIFFWYDYELPYTMFNQLIPFKVEDGKIVFERVI